MISGLKKNTQKQASLCYKSQYEQKFKCNFREGFKVLHLSKTYSDFKKKFNYLRQNSS